MLSFLSGLWNAPFRSVLWLLPVAYTLHDLEEFLWFSETPVAQVERWVGVGAFRVAVTAVTLAAWIVAWLARDAPPRSRRVYAAVAAAWILLLNVLFPHLLATLYFGAYAPGVVTAVLLNSWAAPLVIRAALRDGYATARGSLWATLLGSAVVLAALPVLFAAGSVLTAP
jgi:hypothetical protein